MTLSSVLAASSAVLARNKVVAAVALQPVRHLSLSDLAGCCPERKKIDFAWFE
jgi:hypothetical protein